MTDFLEHYYRHREAVAKANALNKPLVFDALAAAGLTRVTVEFDGEGDSGQISDVTAFSGQAHAPFPSTFLTLHQAAQNNGDPRTTTVNLHDAIEHLCYDYLSQCHDGWETDDGSHGTFEFDVPKQTIELDFYGRFIATEHSSHDF
jgi:hypothetical protein